MIEKRMYWIEGGAIGADNLRSRIGVRRCARGSAHESRPTHER
jgi:hypothetical protein